MLMPFAAIDFKDDRLAGPTLNVSTSSWMSVTGLVKVGGPVQRFWIHIVSKTTRLALCLLSLLIPCNRVDTPWSARRASW